jgi:outer membrane autotransporter protein
MEAMPARKSAVAVAIVSLMWSASETQAQTCPPPINQTTNSNSQVGCTAATNASNVNVTVGPSTGILTINISASGGASDGIHADTGGTGNTGNATATVSNTTIDNQRTTDPSLGINVVSGGAVGSNSPGTATLNMSGTNRISTVAGGGTIANARGIGNATTTISGTLDVDVTAVATGRDEGIETTVRGPNATSATPIATLDMRGINAPSTVSVLGGNAILVDSVPAGTRGGGNVLILGISSLVSDTEDNSTWGGGAFAAPIANAGLAALTFGSGTVNVEGTAATITTRGSLAAGIRAISQLGTVTVNNSGPISTTGTSSHGIQVSTTNSTYDASLVSYSGIPAIPAATTGDVSVTNSGAITTSGGGSAATASHGIFLSTQSIGTGTSGNITLVNGAGGNVTTTGDFSNAILATTASSNGAAGNIKVGNAANLQASGANADGISAAVTGVTGGAIEIENSGSVMSMQAAGVAATTSGGGTTVAVTNASGGSISGATGVDVGTNFTATQVNNAGMIAGAATDGVRVLSGGGTIVNDGANAHIHGQINGVNLPNGGTLVNTSGTIDGGEVGVLGSNGVAVSNSGTITGSGGNAVQFGTGNNSLDLNTNSVTNGNVMMGSGTDITTVHGGATITAVPLFTSTAGLSSLVFSGYSGAARAITSLQLVHFTNGADVAFDGAQQHAAQLFQIDSGATLRFLSNTGTLQGNVTNAGTLDYSAGDASYAITGTLANTGTVRLGSASGVPGNILLVAGNYQGGTGGSVVMNTLLNAGGPLANQFTDRLLVSGNATNATTLLLNATGPGAPTPMSGVESASTGISVVQVGGDSTQGAFVLGNGGVVGNEPFIYHLNAFGPNSTLGASDPAQADPRGSGNHWDYRLQNTYIEEDGGIVLPDDEIEMPNGEIKPPNQDENVETARPQLAPQVPALLTAPLALFQAGYLDVGTLHQRLGEIRYDYDTQTGSDVSATASSSAGAADTTNATSATDASGRPKEVFARIYGGQFRYRTNLGFQNFGYNASIDTVALQIGGMLVRKETDYGVWRYGLAASYGHVWWSPNAVDGNSNGNLDRYTFYGTATYQAHAGWYVDGIVFGGLFDGYVSTNTSSRASNVDGTMVGLSLEAGYPLKLTESGLSFEPQIQVVWQHLAFDSKTDQNGIVNDLGSQDSALLRLGFRLAQPLELQGKYPVTPYFKFNYLQSLTGGGNAEIGRVPFAIGKFGSSVQVGAGITSRLNNRLSIYGDALYQARVNSYGSSGWMANMGLRYSF